MASAMGEGSSFPSLKVVSYGYTTFGRKGGCCLRNPQLYFSPPNLGSSNNSSVTLPSSSTFAHSTLSAYLNVKFRSLHEEPFLISKPSGHHHFWLQTMPFPTAKTSVPSNLKNQKNTSAAEQCLLEALDIIWNQFRCTESNLEHRNPIEQLLKQTISTSDRRHDLRFKYLVRMPIPVVATISGNLDDILRVASLGLDFLVLEGCIKLIEEFRQYRDCYNP